MQVIVLEKNEDYVVLDLFITNVMIANCYLYVFLILQRTKYLFQLSDVCAKNP